MTNRTNVIRVLAALALTFIFAMTALADMRAPANIPFDFEYRGKTMPAGRYEFTASVSGAFVSVLGPDGNQVAGLATPLGNPSVITPSKVVFHYDGETYHLAEIWLRGAGGKKLTYKPRVPAVTSQANPPRRIEIAIPG